MINNRNEIVHVKGDATKPQPHMKGHSILIPHVCNNIGKWGAGFVNALTSEFGPKVRQAYMWWHQGEDNHMSFSPEYLKPDIPMKYISDKEFKLGNVQLVHTGNRITVANMVAQRGTKSEDNPYPIRYGALISCMKNIAYAHYTRGTGVGPRFEIHCPMFGSDLAGGNWEEIEKMINEIWIEQDIPVTVYEFDPTANL